VISRTLGNPSVLSPETSIHFYAIARTTPAGIFDSYYAMTPEDRVRMEVLCAQIAEEKDNRRFTELIRQLIDLLDRSRHADGQHRSPLQAALPQKLAPPKPDLPNE
jgi:hypothetical protein